MYKYQKFKCVVLKNTYTWFMNKTILKRWRPNQFIIPYSRFLLGEAYIFYNSFTHSYFNGKSVGKLSKLESDSPLTFHHPLEQSTALLCAARRKHKIFTIRRIFHWKINDFHIRWNKRRSDMKTCNEWRVWPKIQWKIGRKKCNCCWLTTTRCFNPMPDWLSGHSVS